MTLRKIYIRFKAFSKHLQKNNIGAYASSMAFFFLLSLVPMLIIACAIMRYMPVSESTMTEVLVDFLPGFLGNAILNIFSQAYEQYQAALPIAIIVLLWSAGKGVWGMMMGLNVANETSETRNIIIVRIVASFYSLIILISIIASIGMILIGEKFANMMRNYSVIVADFLNILGNLRFLIVWFFLIVLFTLIYAFLPNLKLKLKYQLPGAIFAATGWTVFSWGFALYVDHFQSFDMYGSLSTLVLIMMWMYTCMYMLLIGANLNNFFDSLFKKIF